MRYRNDPDGTRLPIKVDTATNGEYWPRPLERHSHAANDIAHARGSQNSRRVNMTRRSFLASTCGAASTLLAFNEVHAAYGKTGGFYQIPAAAALEPAAADAALGGDEFIFDIQLHHFNSVDSWEEHSSWSNTVRSTAGATGCNILPDHEFGHMTCIDSRAFVREVFLDSDTDVGLLTYVPTDEASMPLSHAEASATQQIVDALPDGQR